MKLKNHREKKKTSVVSHCQLLLSKIGLRSRILATADACRTKCLAWLLSPIAIGPLDYHTQTCYLVSVAMPRNTKIVSPI